MTFGKTKGTKFSRVSAGIGASFLGLLTLGSGLACSSNDDVGTPTGGAPSQAGSAAGGLVGQGGVAAGGVVGVAGNAGSMALGEGGKATAGMGGTAGAAGTSSSGGTTGGGGANAGNGGHAGTGGAGGAAGGGAGGSSGGSAGSTGFDPCPATGDCKVVAMGDSITFGTPTNNGGYRVKLFTNARMDNRHLTLVAGKVDTSAGSSTGPSGPSAPPSGPAMVMVGGMNVTFPRDNEGYPGITIGDIDARRCANGNGFTNMPNIVLLHIGTNDMYGGNPGAAPAKLSKIVDDIAAAAPNALIAVASLIPLSSGNDAVKTYNATIPAMVQMKAGAGKHVIFVDQYKDFPTSELTDGIHPNDSNGYPRMANVWYAAIKSYLH